MTIVATETDRRNIENAEAAIESAHRQVESLDASIAEHETNLAELRRDRAKALRNLKETEAFCESLRSGGPHS